MATELSLLASVTKMVGLVPDERYLPFLLLIPVIVSLLIEIVKQSYKHFAKKSLTGHGMQTVQALMSAVMAVVTIILIYGSDIELKDMVARCIAMTLIFAKISTYVYKGLPIVSAIPVVKNISTKTLFEKFEAISVSNAEKKIAQLG